MKLTLFYFSGTGNTWWISQQFAYINKQSNHKVEIIAIENKETKSKQFLKEKLQSTTGLGIAYPIYGSTAPKIVWDFMELLADTADLKSEIQEEKQENEKFGFILTTMALFSGDGALVLREKMKKIGFPLRGAINFKLASNISVPGFKYNPVSKKKLEKRKKKAIDKLTKFIQKISNGRQTLEGRWNIFGKLGGWIQRVLMDWFLRNTINWKADMDTCTKCKLCINHCPTANITLENGEITFLDSCTYCMRCYNYCPTYAITPVKKLTDPDKFKRHRGCVEDFKLDFLHK